MYVSAIDYGKYKHSDSTIPCSSGPTPPTPATSPNSDAPSTSPSSPKSDAEPSTPPNSPDSAPVPTPEQQIIAAQQSQLQLANEKVNYLYYSNITLQNQLNSAVMYIGKLKSEINNTPSAFSFTEINKWSLINGKGKRIPIATIAIKSVTYLTFKEGNIFDHICVEYTTESEQIRIAHISYEDFSKHRFLSHFLFLNKNVECTDKIANELLYRLIIKCEAASEIKIPRQTGWETGENDSAYYIRGNNFDSANFKNFIPANIINNRLSPTNESCSDILSAVLEILPDCFEAYILMAYRIAGLMNSIFKSIGLESKQILIVEGNQPRTAEIAISFLKIFNRPSLETLPLESSKKEIERVLSEARDSTVLFRDITIHDNEKKRIESLNFIVSVLSHAHPDIKACENNIAIISNAASSLLPSEFSFSLLLNATHFNKSAKEYQTVFEKMDAYIINYIEKNFTHSRDILKQTISLLNEQAPANMSESAANTYFTLMSVLFFISYVLHHQFVKQDIMDLFIATIQRNNNSRMGSYQAVVNEFSRVLNTALHDEKLKLIEHTESIDFGGHDSYAIVWNNYICLEPETIENILLPEMTVTQSLIKLGKALNEFDLLYTTKKNLHPIHIYSKDGTSKIINTYSISCNILDKENIDTVENLHNHAFFCANDELPCSDFLPLIVNTKGNIAGILEAPHDKSNRHIYVTGNSGQGKSILLAQLIYHSSLLNHKVVVFDINDSFTPDSLCRSIPREFIDNNITFHSIENDGVPVDLFNLQDYIKPAQKKKVLSGILSAPFKTFSEVQSSSMKSVISDLFSVTDKDEKISPEDILCLFNDKNPTHKSIITRLSSVFNDIEGFGMSEKTWADFISQSKNIIIITMANCVSDTGNNPLCDMMLATLFNYQLRNSDCQLDIIIDEIQNQNMNPTGPIMKIMKEGRKYLISFVGATQPYSKKGNAVGDAMQYAATNIFLKPTSGSETDVASELNLKQHEIKKFNNMQPGECFVKGDLYNTEFKRNNPAILRGKVYLPHGLSD
ncbi:MAG: hypothetical protein PUB66_06965 [Oscillospiraceae bacterium]|nr:hypothetical protein [Oscillospiraceae bacterium]